MVFVILSYMLPIHEEYKGIFRWIIVWFIKVYLNSLLSTWCSIMTWSIVERSCVIAVDVNRHFIQIKESNQCLHDCFGAQVLHKVSCRIDSHVFIGVDQVHMVFRQISQLGKLKGQTIVFLANSAFTQHCLYCLTSLRNPETSHSDFGYGSTKPKMFGLLVEFINQ